MLPNSSESSSGRVSRSERAQSFPKETGVRVVPEYVSSFRDALTETWARTQRRIDHTVETYAPLFTMKKDVSPELAELSVEDLFQQINTAIEIEDDSNPEHLIRDLKLIRAWKVRFEELEHRLALLNDSLKTTNEQETQKHSDEIFLQRDYVRKEHDQMKKHRYIPFSLVAQVFNKISEVFKTNVTSITEEYRKIALNLQQDSSYQQDFREAYFQTHAQQKLLQEAKKEHFPNEVLESIQKALYRSFVHEEIISQDDFPSHKDTALSFCEAFTHSLQFQEDVSLFFVSHMASEDIELLMTKMINEASDPEEVSAVRRASIRHLFEHSDSFSQSVGENLFSNAERTKEYRTDFIEQWTSFKHVRLAEQSFPAEVRGIDSSISSTLNENALHLFENAIQSLKYYKTPESLRTILVLGVGGYLSSNAAAYEQYMLASEVMKSFVSSPDWPQLVEQSIHEYPSLAPAKETLLSAEPEMHESLFYLMDLSMLQTFFVEQLIQKGSENRSLTQRLLEASSTEVLLEATYKTGKCTSEEWSKITQAMEQMKTDWTPTEVLTDIPQDAQQGDIQSIIYAVGLKVFQGSLPRTLTSIFLQADDPELMAIHQEQVNVTYLLSLEILSQFQDANFWKFLEQRDTLKHLFSGRFETSQFSAYLLAHQTIPELASDERLTNSFAKGFQDFESVNQLRKLLDMMPDQSDLAGILMFHVSLDFFTWDELFSHLKEIPEILEKNHITNVLVRQYPDYFLPSTEDRRFLQELSSAYGKRKTAAIDMVSFLMDGVFSREEILRFPQEIPALLTDATLDARHYLLSRQEVLVRTPMHFELVKKVAKEFSGATLSILQQYMDCVQAGVIEPGDQQAVLEFVRKVRALSPETFVGYKNAKKSGLEEVYLTHLSSMAHRMAGNAPLSDEDRAKPYYRSLLQHVFPNHSGAFSLYQEVEACEDRSADLNRFILRPRYDIDTLKGNGNRLQAGMKQDIESVREIQIPLRQIELELSYRFSSQAELMQSFESSLDEDLVQVLKNESSLIPEMSRARNVEEKIITIALDSLFGSKIINTDQLKNFLLTYDALRYGSPEEYIQENSARISEEESIEYGQLLELNQLFTDTMRLHCETIIQKALQNNEIRARVQAYFLGLSEERLRARQESLKHRLQLEKLGMSDSFLAQIGKTLQKRRNRSFSKNEIKSIVRRYEVLTGGLPEKMSTSPDASTRSFYGQLRSQREQTFRARAELTGQVPNPSEYFLGAMNIADLQAVEQKISEATYDEESFTTYLVQRMYDLFEQEQLLLEDELNKFESEKGYKRETLHGYITKTKESAFARLSSGVCVAVDNPSPENSNSMWNMPNFFQLVLQDPSSNECMGASLLHYFEDQGKKILVSSPNPSSTYLLSHDEEAVYHGIQSALELFAKDNDIDLIVHAEDETIRTNRRDGQFEKALKNQVFRVDQKFVLSSRQLFSIRPRYTLLKTDAVWVHPKNK